VGVDSWAIIALVVLVGVGVAAIVAAVIQRRRFEADGRAVGPRPVELENRSIERRRQRAVDALQIVDTPAEERFDHIVTLARAFYGTEAAAFSVIDHDREWRKAREGEADEEIDRAASFCSVTIRGDGPLVVGDASRDERFAQVSRVVQEDGVRFYAGVPIQAPDGEQIGALCVFDHRARDADSVDATKLRELGHLIEAELRATTSR
jgi:GAF domain-containing protein